MYIGTTGGGRMQIAVWVEPKMFESNWYHEMENGLLAALSSKHLKATFRSLDVPDETATEGCVLVLVGETYEWYCRMLSFTNERQITACVAGCEHPMHSAITVTSDYTQVAYNMIQYLYDAGKRRIAFFGVNPSSPHDNMRLEAYYQAIRNMDIACTEQDIYYTKGDIRQCVSMFQQQIRTYDAVLGANDLYAFFALMTARDVGLCVPEDLYIAGFGNTMISAISKPPITTATVNLYNIGYQVVAVIQMLSNNDSLIQLDIKSDDVYFARESTESRPFSEKYRHRPNQPTVPNHLCENGPVTSFNDENFMDVVCYESLFRYIDETDYSIITSIIEKQYSKRSMITGDCFLSDTSLEYRLKKLYKRLRVSSYAELYLKLMKMSQNVDIVKLKCVKISDCKVRE